MKQIVPAVLVYSEDEFTEKMTHADVRKVATLWQIDILDGSMFGETCWADAEAASKLQLPDIELHLMINNPLPALRTWVKHIPSVKRAIVHAEIDRPLMSVLDEIEQLNLETGVALNPESSLEEHAAEIERADVLLIMGVHPGKSGQGFLGDKVLEKIAQARKLFPEKTIALDGGVTLENAKQILEAGVDQLCASSAIWKASDPKQAFTALSKLV